MLAKLLLAFTLIPLFELLVLIPIAQNIGLWPTIAVVLVTAIAGAWLAKVQGLGAWKRLQNDLAQGRLPGDSLLDGILILVACTLLVTPGVLTDVVGIGLLLPFTRKPLRTYLKKRFTKQLHNPTFTVIDVAASEHHGVSDFRPGSKTRGEDSMDIIDVTPVDRSD